jgi:hypothetical protein
MMAVKCFSSRSSLTVVILPALPHVFANLCRDSLEHQIHAPERHSNNYRTASPNHNPVEGLALLWTPRLLDVKRGLTEDFVDRLRFCQPWEISRIWIWLTIDQPLRFLVHFDYQWQREIWVWWRLNMHLVMWRNEIWSSWKTRPGDKVLEDSI